MTIHELKKDLQDTLDFLEKRFNGDEQVRVVSNTYFLTTQNHFLATRKGFIDLDNPIGCKGDEDDD